MSKKEQREREKRMASFMTAKSTAKLKEEIEKVLAEDIPDPVTPAFDFNTPAIPKNVRETELDLMEQMDRAERAAEEDENSQRY
tara:strand:+ start:119 stop:370 length:252 start_codon:yes stop_codon:yes gene_type:complete